MAEAVTFAVTAQVLLAIGEDASATQILQDNVNLWTLQAEGLIQADVGADLVTGYDDFTNWQKEILRLATTSKAAMIAINQNQNSWSLAVTQSKLNVLDALYKESIIDIRKFAE